MRSLTLAALFAVAASSAMALTTMPLPTLSFPSSSGEVTQGCSSISTGKIVCE